VSAITVFHASDEISRGKLPDKKFGFVSMHVTGRQRLV